MDRPSRAVTGAGRRTGGQLSTRRPAGKRRAHRGGARRALRYVVLGALLAPLRYFPPTQARRLGASYGRVAWWLMPRLRRRTRLHLKAAFPEWPATRHEEVARGVTPWIGRTGADFLQLGRGARSAVRRDLGVEGLEHWKAATSAGSGVVATTGHFGHWELLGAWFATLGPTVTVLYHPFPEERLDRLVRSIRERAGVEALPADGNLGSALRALRRGGVLGVVIDRPPRGGGIEDRFFGRPCRTAPGAARIAWLAGAPLLPAALWSERDRYRVSLRAPLWVRSEEEVVDVTRRLTAILEEQIRVAPEQWPWFENRWKVRSKSIGNADVG